MNMLALRQLSEGTSPPQGARARDRWRETVAESFAGFRLDCIKCRTDLKQQQMLIRMGLAEIIALRLQAAYAPLLAPLRKMERQLEILADSGGERWAPKKRRRRHKHE